MLANGQLKNIGGHKQSHPGAEQAVQQVKVRLALEKIAKLEKIKVTKKDIDEEIKRIADSYKMEPDKVREMVPEESVAEDMKVKKAMDLVKEQAVVKA